MNILSTTITLEEAKDLYFILSNQLSLSDEMSDLMCRLWDEINFIKNTNKFMVELENE